MVERKRLMKEKRRWRKGGEEETDEEEMVEKQRGVRGEQLMQDCSVLDLPH